MPRFNPNKYDPLADSAGGHTIPLVHLASLQREHGGVILSREPGECLCGCGGQPSGSKRHFLMGHDARYRGKLLRAHLQDVPVVLVTAATDDAEERIEGFTAMELAAKLDWGHYLVAAVERRGNVERTVVADAVGSERLVRVGRWEYTGLVAAVYDVPGPSSSLSRKEYEIDYVTKQGERKRVRVPADKTSEVAS